MKRSEWIDEIIIATTTNKTDDPIINFCDKLGLKYFRGSEEDVLERFYYTAMYNNADVIIRLTSDCPLIDPKEIDKVISVYIKSPNYDYVSNTLVRSYPRGLDTEIFSFLSLKKAHVEAKKNFEREHVTPYLYKTNKFLVGNVTYEKDVSNYRWTVDTNEDFELIKKIIENIYPQNELFSLEDLLELMIKFPKWTNINNHIE